jgi:uncharacterized protein (DUF1778 family)
MSTQHSSSKEGAGALPVAVTQSAEPIDALLDRRLFVLDTERYNAFMQGLDGQPAPGPKLRALLRRVPAWRT